MESDQAGRLRAFRKRFGRRWDADRRGEEELEEAEAKKTASSGSNTLGDEEEGEIEKGEKERDEEGDSLMDLISGFAEDEGKPSKKR